MRVYTDAAITTRPLRTGETLTREGGIAHPVDRWTRLRRYLILGSELGTFYTPEPDFTIQNIEAVQTCLVEDGGRTVGEIVAISQAGRAPKNDPAILALAMATLHPDAEVRRTAFEALPTVCRIGTHVLHFAAYRQALGGGWGRGMRRAVGHWFAKRPPREMAYQAVKYPSRDGWAMRDLLRLAHPKFGAEPSFVAGYICKGWPEDVLGLDLFESAQWLRDIEVIRGDTLATATKATAIRTLRVPREALPTETLNSPEIWEALLADMPITAMIRNLGKMTNVGLISPGSAASLVVVSRLMDPQRLQKGRVHPIQLLAASKVYEQGHGERGKLAWTPDRTVIGALTEAFYLAFGTVERTGQKIRLALDVSSSMDGSKVVGMPFLSAREAAAAMALVTTNVEPDAHLMAYSNRLVPLTLRPSMRLDEVIRIMRGIDFGGTYCTLPILDAMQTGAEVDLFVSYTDSETWNGGHRRFYGYAAPPSEMTAGEALRSYRMRTGRDAKHAVCAFTANDISIAEPGDAGQLDFVGLDGSMPALLADFALGRL